MSRQEKDNSFLEILSTLDVEGVAITATVDPVGKLGKIGGLWDKLGKQTVDLAHRGLLHTVVVAAEQDNVPEAYRHEDAELLRVIPASTVDEAIHKLNEQSLPRRAVLKNVLKECAKLEIIGRRQKVTMEKLYQELPLLREVKREELPRFEEEHGEIAELYEDERNRWPATELLLRWEEEMQQKQVKYERYELKALFTNFAAVVEKKAVSNVPRFVVLGPPGSGKTTFEQHLALQTALGELKLDERKLIPVRVRLRDWERWVVKEIDPEPSLPEYLAELHKDLNPAPTVEQWRRWLQRGEILLLLDGLDEISSKPSFDMALKNALSFSNCPTVLSCRTVSFERHQTLCSDPEKMPVFTLSGLDDAKRDAYIRAFPAKHRKRFDSDALITQLNRMPQMRPLASNPLLLSIICYVVDDPRGVQLPATRTELYEKAVEKLLLRPKRVDVRYPTSGGDLPLTRKCRILERAALTLFRALEGERQLTFDEGALLDALQQGAFEEGYRTDPAMIADTLLMDLTQNSGILRGNTERGYFFLHLTIHEFLTACALAREARKRGFQAIEALADKKSWLPTWQEVIVFLAGKLPDEHCERLLTLLADETKDDLFRHRLALAAHCLPEILSALQSQLSAHVNRITTSAFSLWWEHSAENTEAAVPHLTKVLPALAQVDGMVNDTPLIVWLCERLKQLDDKDRNVRASAADALGAIGELASNHPDVIPALVYTAQYDKDDNARKAAERALDQMRESASNHPNVPPGLVPALYDKKHSDFARLWAMHLAELEDRIPGLLHDLYDEYFVRYWASDRQAADTLGRHLWAANALGRMEELVVQHPDLIPILVHTLRDNDKSSSVRSSVAYALGQIGELAAKYPDLIPGLVHALHDESREVRSSAADALGRMGESAANYPDVIPGLIHALREKEWPVRTSAAEALGMMMRLGFRLFAQRNTLEAKRVTELAGNG